MVLVLVDSLELNLLLVVRGLAVVGASVSGSGSERRVPAPGLRKLLYLFRLP